jgi:F-type H+-transporting ATPase subunit gamma
MASLREIRRKIKSVKSTQQITKAMKMVAAARLRRAQARILSARPFAQKMEELMTNLLIKIDGEQVHPLFAKRQGERRVLLLVTSDRGLCGAFNTNLIRETLKYLTKYGSQNVDLFIVGRKGRDYFRRFGTHISKDYINIADTLSFANAELILADLLTGYQSQPWVAVDMLYNEFKSVIQQKLVVKTLLPLTPIEYVEVAPWPDFIYEPAKEELLEVIILRFLKSRVLRVLLESSAAELGARMVAMDNATRNAEELMSSLTLTMNRTRQSSITKEILEVVSGAEALK